MIANGGEQVFEFFVELLVEFFVELLVELLILLKTFPRGSLISFA